MAICSVFYTANAGFFVTVGGITLAVDAFPRLTDRGFSALSDEDFQFLCRERRIPSPDYVITTHDHPDHYSASRTAAFLAQHPGARLIGVMEPKRLPEGAVSPILLTGDRHTYYFPGITLEFLRLPHEGERFQNIPNYGCLASVSQPRPCRILFLGDATPADPAIVTWLAGRSVDLALFNFPWITLPKGRRFIECYLSQTNLGILHLPYPQDDRNGYNKAAESAAANWSHAGSICLFQHFSQQEIL